jgi:AraC-like DNA-binding protein
MSDRTFIVLGEAGQLVRELREALPGARIIQTECLDHIPPLKEAQNARILVGHGSLHPCCIEKLEQWIAEPSPIQGEERTFDPSETTGAGHRSANDAWTERALLMSGQGASQKVKAFIAVAKEHDHEWFTVQEAARSLGCSVRHIRRLVEQELSYRPQILLHLARIDSVARALERSGPSISAIASLHRFPGLPTMSHQFKRYVGESPRQYRRRRSVQMAETDKSEWLKHAIVFRPRLPYKEPNDSGR